MASTVLNAARRVHRKAAARYAASLRDGNEEEVERAECALEEAALVLAAAVLAVHQRELRKGFRHGN